MRYRRIAAALAAAVLCTGLCSCSGTNKDEPSAASEIVVNADGVGDLIEPPEDDPEYNLGTYRYSASGVKLYYEEENYPTDLLLFIEKLFSTYPARDYDTYRSCIHPTYVESMEEYLPKEFDYDLNTSFTNRCDTLNVQMGGSYRITRIRATVPMDGDFSDAFFDQLTPICGEGYGAKIREDSDKVYCVQLDIMVQTDEEGAGEQIFFNNSDKGMGIVIVRKDGQYYAFC